MDDGMNERKLVSVVILVGHPVVTMMQSGKCKIDSVVPGGMNSQQCWL